MSSEWTVKTSANMFKGCPCVPLTHFMPLVSIYPLKQQETGFYAFKVYINRTFAYIFACRKGAKNVLVDSKTYSVNVCDSWKFTSDSPVKVSNWQSLTKKVDNFACLPPQSLLFGKRVGCLQSNTILLKQTP